MPSRKFHGKTRHGCKTCKQRKVRCDLGRPDCHNCTRLSRHCVYADELPTGVAAAGRRELTGSPTSTAGSQALSTTVARPLPTIELELMHHYTNCTSHTISAKDALMRLWQTVIPQMALNHHFLMHAILAMASLHKRHEDSGARSSELLDLARHHQQECLEAYIPLLSNITEDNCGALFAASQLIAGASHALLTLKEENNGPQAFIRGVTGIFKLAIGAAAIATQGAQWLRRSELAPILEPVPPVLRWSAVTSTDASKDALQSILDYTAFLQRRDLPAGPVLFDMGGSPDCYTSVVEKLYALFPSPPHRETNLDNVIGWPVFFEKAYLELLTEQEPAALAILAYYGVLLHRLRNFWWLEGVGPRLVHSIVEVLPDDWQHHLDQAKKEVGQ